MTGNPVGKFVRFITRNAHHGARDFDVQLRQFSQFFALFPITATFIYALLPLGAEGTNRPALLLTSLLGYLTILGVAIFPWRRVHRDLYLVTALVTLVFITAFVAFSGGWHSPFQSYFYLAAVFHVIYYRLRIALPLNLLTFALSLAPAVRDSDWGGFVEYALAYGASFLVLSVLVSATVQEVRRRERQIGVLVHRQRASEREAAQFAALQRVGLLMNSHHDAREAMAALVGELSASLGYPYVSIHLAEGDDDALTTVASVGYPEGRTGTRVSLRGSTIGRVFASGVSALTRDVSAGADDQQPLPGVRGTASVPVREDARVVGVLTVESRETLDTRDLESLELFAQQVGIALANAHRYTEEHDRAARGEALREVGLVLAASLDLDAVLNDVLNQLARVLPHDGAAVLTRTSDDLLRPAATRGPFTDDAMVIAHGIDAHYTRLAREQERGNGGQLLPAYFLSEPPDADANGIATFPAWIGSLIAAPLVIEGALHGVILVAATQRGQYTQADADLVGDFARHAGMALRNAERHDAVARSARTDALTGVLNHGGLRETLAREVKRAGRYDHPLSILFFDLDHFKVINDTYGHQFGDDLLRAFAQLTREIMRDVDSVGRYGGEEFIAVLPETDYPAALLVAERLRECVATYPLPAPATPEARITISIGVTNYPTDGITVDALIRAADTALYAAKRQGRDCVCSYRDVAGVPALVATD